MIKLRLYYLFGMIKMFHLHERMCSRQMIFTERSKYRHVNTLIKKEKKKRKENDVLQAGNNSGRKSHDAQNHPSLRMRWPSFVM